jgi:hypothetical protein
MATGTIRELMVTGTIPARADPASLSGRHGIGRPGRRSRPCVRAPAQVACARGRGGVASTRHRSGATERQKAPLDARSVERGEKWFAVRPKRPTLNEDLRERGVFATCPASRPRGGGRLLAPHGGSQLLRAARTGSASSRRTEGVSSSRPRERDELVAPARERHELVVVARLSCRAALWRPQEFSLETASLEISATVSPW